ncbi:S8 family serine peptidase [Candidatus Leptofilum sp.]|uniref:S8 family serine peptidase n=1 Tax=Candidatus Leptofilum sp. TaxID=3241576 RepID=UPI003B5C0051
MATMQRRISILFFSVSIALGLIATLFLAAARFDVAEAAQNSDKIDPALFEALADGTAVRFIADLAETAVLPTNPAAKMELVDSLQQTAASSQARALSLLDELAATNDATAVRSLWLVNSIAATGNLTAVQAIANLPEVVQVRPDVIVQKIGATDTPTATLLAANAAVVTGPVASWGIQKINAPHVWHGLGIDGGGVTVAIMDTGVDWEHPDLMENYRGNQGGTVDHAGNWFNAVFPTDTIPVDSVGHGTHVAGTAVGHNGIGVAPGANWIAVNVADPLGFIWESDVHRGFEWLLAPNGDVALAPDVVNNSWGSPFSSELFVEDVAALHAAGIQVVFSSGNSGPFEGTVGYPAGYPDVLSVGASDEIDDVAWFSSRGPSLQTDEPKPWLVAPGTQIWSARPDGAYGLENGTSMAAPHVAGTIALLLSVNPSLTRAQVNQILAETAVPFTTTHPNNDSGWGRLDAYAAVAPQVTTGVLTGQLLGADLPLPNSIITITTPSGAMLPFVTDSNGRYQAILQSGSYTLTAAPFGYTQITVSNVVVSDGQTTTRDLAVNLLPNGRVLGTVRSVSGYTLLPNAQIEIVGTPFTLLTDGNGAFDAALPVGNYELIVTKTGYQQQRAEVWIGEGTAVVQPFFLADAPTILLVDSGQWYFSSQAAPYREALTAINYSFDTWTVRSPIQVPKLDTLSQYEAVIWSSPLDSPGYLGLNDVITDYLGLGGNLFISGQNLGYFDGLGLSTQVWWYRDLNARYLGKTAVTQTISGSDDSLFNGLNFTLNGGSSSNNQTAPDISDPRLKLLSDPAFLFEDGQAAGLTAGYCAPFQLVYLGFGLEGVPEAADRADILARSFDHFNQPREQFGVQFFPDTIDELAIPGTQMAYTVDIFNRSETLTDTFTLTISGAAWEADLVTKTVTLGPCQGGQTILTIEVPPELDSGEVESLRVTAVSQNNPAYETNLTVQLAAPGNILFVDDDRWYDQSAELTAAMDSMGLTYDVWDTEHATVSRNGPPLALLNQYDFVIWYTGYDWFQPLTYDENLALEAYLAQGGRLFLTSQDFLYYHRHTPLAQHYFGVESYLESIDPTRLIGYGNAADILPLPLTFDPYQNHGDGILPADHSQPFLWSDRALPAGTATAGDDWRAVFWAVPFETITPTRQAEAMNQVIGWLSDLGDSTFTVDQRVGNVGEPRTYAITIRQSDGGLSNTVWMTNTLSPWLQIDLNSVTGEASYNAATRQLTWSGALPSGGSHVITYQATPGGLLPSGELIENELLLHDGRHDLTFTRHAQSWVQASDILVAMTAVPNQPLAATVFTTTVMLQNVGLAASGQISTVVSLPNSFYIVTDTLGSSAGSATVGDRRLYWEGTLDVAAQVTVTLVLTRAGTAVPQRIAITTLVNDGVTAPTFFAQWADLPVFTQYLPILRHNPEP